MLNDLKVLNGNLELKYNEYTYEYTVKVDNDIDSLELEYTLKEDCYIEIENNTLLEGNNTVYLNVYNVDESITYTLYVYKEKAETVSGIDSYKKALEINSVKEIQVYKVQLLTTSIFLIILIIFSIMFKRKKID